MFDRRGELLDGLVGVAVLDSFAHAMVEVAFEDDLAALVQGAFGGVDLHEDVFARDVFVDHFVDRVDLSYDFAEPSVKIFGIHALAHNRPPGEKRFTQGA